MRIYQITSIYQTKYRIITLLENITQISRKHTRNFKMHRKKMKLMIPLYYMWITPTSSQEEWIRMLDNEIGEYLMWIRLRKNYMSWIKINLRDNLGFFIWEIERLNWMREILEVFHVWGKNWERRIARLTLVLRFDAQHGSGWAYFMKLSQTCESLVVNSSEGCNHFCIRN